MQCYHHQINENENEKIAYFSICAIFFFLSPSLLTALCIISQYNTQNIFNFSRFICFFLYSLFANALHFGWARIIVVVIVVFFLRYVCRFCRNSVCIPFFFITFVVVYFTCVSICVLAFTIGVTIAFSITQCTRLNDTIRKYMCVPCKSVYAMDLLPLFSHTKITVCFFLLLVEFCLLNL